MPKLLYIWQSGFPWEVRVEKFVLTLAAAGYDVTILARHRPGEPVEDEYRGVRIRRVGAGRAPKYSVPISANPLWRAAIRQEVQRNRPDLIMAREIMLAEAAADACAAHPIPMIIDMAEHYPATMRAFEKYRRTWFQRLVVFGARLPDRVERRSVARADGILTVCSEQNVRLTRDYGYDPARLAIVHNTPDLAFFADSIDGAARPPRVFAYHGSMSAQRGLDTLIRGFGIAAAKHPDIRLELAGRGESLEMLERLARELRLEQRVNFVGGYEYAELPALYRRTDVGVIAYPIDTSVEHTIGNKLFEYMACGKPVLVTPASPLRRIIEETGAGLVLENSTPEAIAGGIECLLARDVSAMAAAGLAAAREKYNWSRDATVMLDFLERYR